MLTTIRLSTSTCCWELRLANVKILMGRTLSLGPWQLKTLLAFCEVQRVSSCGPHGRRHGAYHDQNEHFHVLSGIAYGTSPQSRLRLFSLRIRRPQFSGCRRVVRPQGESPGMVAS